MNQEHNRNKLAFLSIALTISAICFLYEASTLITYTLLAYFPDPSSSENIVASYGHGFTNNFSIAVCLFIAMVIIKLFFNNFIAKNTTVISDNKIYNKIKFVSLSLVIILFIYLILYPVSFFLDGGSLVESLISFFGILALSLFVAYIVFEKQVLILNKKYVSFSILAILAIYLVTLGYYDFSAYGFPREIKQARIDIKRMSDLSAINEKIVEESYTCSSQSKCTLYLPEDLLSFSKKHSDINVFDPITKQPYSYKTSVVSASSTDFSVCANFTYDYSKLIRLIGENNIPYGFIEKNSIKTGESCINNNVDTLKSEFLQEDN